MLEFFFRPLVRVSPCCCCSTVYRCALVLATLRVLLIPTILRTVLCYPKKCREMEISTLDLIFSLAIQIPDAVMDLANLVGLIRKNIGIMKAWICWEIFYIFASVMLNCIWILNLVSKDQMPKDQMTITAVVATIFSVLYIACYYYVICIEYSVVLDLEEE